MKARNKDGGGKEESNCKVRDSRSLMASHTSWEGSEPEPPLPSCKHIAAEQDG